MTHQTLNFQFQKTDFFGQFWKTENVKAVVLILHGLGEHSGRFTEVAENLIDNGYGVAAFDHFGHGKTTGKRGHNPGYESVLDSIAQFIIQTKEIFGDVPLFLYGHSMGGNAVLNYMISRDNNIKGVIVTSAFLKLAFQPPAWKLFFGRIIQKIAPSMTLDNEIDTSFISRIPEEVEKYENDSLVHNRVSPNFSLSFIERGAWAIENAHRLRKPILLLHGTDDKLISCEGSKEFAKNNPENSTLNLYEGGYHELHNDLCKTEVINDIISWLNNNN
ncbi:lysophospholipase [Tenacibaculum sp. MEBiC06402]|uniref:alpha/beta hydrolase n=1 Tax=unclassified Tenacibaculum TaxID=2635139 RepID=UPI003B9D5DFC